eukprot:1959894-Alexandrium_andersonii.AAC.1
MSASLVGSEMCIRDRCRSLRRSSLKPWRSPCAMGGPVRRAKAVRRAQPVSYTHLTLPTICSV